MKRIWHVHTTDHYSSIKMNGSLTHATEWVNFENTVLSKTSQMQRTTITCFHLYEAPNKQTHKEKRNNRSYQGLRKGEVGRAGQCIVLTERVVGDPGLYLHDAVTWLPASSF